MSKLKRFAALTIVAAILLSLISVPGIHPLSVQADAASAAISETYPEATELLTNLGIMNNTEKAWTDYIKGAEVNKVAYDLLFATYNWSFGTFGRSDFAADEYVSGEAMFYNIVPTLYFSNAMDEQIWVDYFRLARGLKNYDEKAALTREQAAQIFVNVLKAPHNFNPASQEQRADFLGIHYTQVSTDTVGRPTYQWIRSATGETVSSAYVQEPIAVFTDDQVVTWSDMFNAVGETPDNAAAMIYWAFRPFAYQICADGQYGEMQWAETAGGNASVFDGNLGTVEIYDTYSKFLPDIGGNTFTMQLFRIVTYSAPTTVSETYPEATELLTNLGVMNDAKAAWTDYITGAEVNKVAFDLFFSTYNWSFGTFGRSDFAADQYVSGEAMLYNIVPALGFFNGMDEQIWVDYFRLTRDVQNYDEKAALTREQAAQIFVNTLKAAHEWNRRSQEQRADFLGIHYTFVGNDHMGRPTYQWIRTATGEAVSSAYAQKPIAVLTGGQVTWSDLFNAVGETQEEAGLLSYWGDYYSFRPFAYQICAEGSLGDPAWIENISGNSTIFQTNGYTVEIYDTYSKLMLDLAGDGKPFTMQMFRLVCYSDLLVECKTEGGVKSVYMYGDPSGNSYGAWGTGVGAPGAAFGALEDGTYVAHWSGAYATLNDPEPAARVQATLTAFDTSAGTVTYGSTTAKYSTRFHKGYNLMTDANIGKTFAFFMDRNGYVVSMSEDVEPVVEICGADGTAVKCLSLTAALAELDADEYLSLLEDVEENITATKDIRIDLNGHTLAGTVNMGSYELQGMDSTTNGYTAGTGKLTATVTGTVAKTVRAANAKRYVAVQHEDGSYTFDRFYIGITALMAHTVSGEIEYKAVVGGNENVKSALADENAYGFVVQLQGSDPVVTGKSKDTFIVGAGGNEKTLTIKNQLAAVNEDNTLVDKAVSAKVFITLKDGTKVEGTEYSYTIASMFQIVDSTFNSLKDASKAGLKALYIKYPVMEGWNLTNIAAYAG